MVKDRGTYDIIFGRNPVLEALKGDRTVEKILVSKGLKGTGKELINTAKDAGIRIEHVDKTVLDKVAGTDSHQGVIAMVTTYRYAEGIEQLIEYAERKGEYPFIVVLDKIKDPHNLGAIIRTAHCCGVHGVVIPKKNAAGVTQTVVKVSAGAVEYLPVVRVANIAHTLERMKGLGLWIAGADMNGEIMYDVQLTGPLGLVIGSEGKGISRLVREKCDFVAKIPMKGRVASLNASVAAGILMYEIFRQRMK